MSSLIFWNLHFFILHSAEARSKGMLEEEMIFPVACISPVVDFSSYEVPSSIPTTLETCPVRLETLLLMDQSPKFYKGFLR